MARGAWGIMQQGCLSALAGKASDAVQTITSGVTTMPRFGLGVVASSGPSWSLHGGSGSNAGAHRLLVGKSEFFLIVIDEDRKQFTVEGPVADDRPWSTAIAAAQHEGWS
jgi:hypothetical protein